MSEPEEVIADEAWLCWNCMAPEPPIFLCGSGWVCEQCFRDLSGLPDDVSSDDLHDGINEGRWKEQVDRVNLYAEMAYEEE